MVTSHPSHRSKHQYSIEYVQKDLMRYEVPCVALRILDKPEDAPHENQQTSHIKCIELPFPWYGLRIDFWCRLLNKTGVENDSGDDEEAEKEKLNDQATDNDFLPSV
jgi:hypothetical protein